MSTCKRIHVLMCYYYGLMIGLTSLSYDQSKRKVIQTRRLKIYCMCLNVLMLTLVPLSLNYNRRSLHQYFQKPLVQKLDYFNIISRFLVIILALISRLPRDRQLLKITLKLCHLEAKHFDGIHAQPGITRKINTLFYGKFYSLSYQCLTLVMGRMAQVHDWRQLDNLFSQFYIVNFQNILQCIMFHFFMLLLFVCKRFMLINQQLLDILERVQELQRLRHPLSKHSLTLAETYRQYAADISRLAAAHSSLCELVQQINKVYEFQAFCALFSLIFNHISVGFYVFLFVNGGIIKFDTILFRFVCFSYFMFYVDLYLMNRICAETVNAAEETIVILRKFRILPVLTREFEQSCEMFALQLSRQKLCINICGMFNLDQHASFVIFYQIVLQTLILVQFDIKERLNSK